MLVGCVASLGVLVANCGIKVLIATPMGLGSPFLRTAETTPSARLLAKVDVNGIKEVDAASLLHRLARWPTGDPWSSERKQSYR